MNIFLSVKSFIAERLRQKLFHSEIIWKTKFHPPGHYYSPHVDHEWIEKQKNTIFDINDNKIPGIVLNELGQYELLQCFLEYYNLLDFPETKDTTHKFYYQNQYFSYSDAITLSCMMLHVKPNRIVEIGSGYSSAVMVDINDKFFKSKINLSFIEPFPEQRLNMLLGDNEGYEIYQEFVQLVPKQVFQSLEENDILFIDSSHVSKTGSDVNYLLFEILPILKPGVIIHIHDIFFPFEYPIEWVLEDRAWNEAYLVRAFLQYNSSFTIKYFSSYMEKYYSSWFEKNMPKCLNHHETWKSEDGSSYLLNTTGQSLYLVKNQ